MLAKMPKSREQIIYEHRERARIRRALLSRVHPGNEPRYRAPHWIVARTVVGQERFARDAIQSKFGNQVFFPRIRTGPEKLKALFPGYVFIKIVGGSWLHLQYSPGIVQIVKNGAEPARVADREINQLFKEQGKDGYIDQSPSYPEPKEGDSCYIMKGVFKFWVARYIGRAPDKSFRFEFEFMGKPTQLDIQFRSEFMILASN